MEVSVYMNLVARTNNKPTFKRVVVNPDVFDPKEFAKCMRSVFGSDCVVEILYV